MSLSLQVIQLLAIVFIYSSNTQFNVEKIRENVNWHKTQTRVLDEWLSSFQKLFIFNMFSNNFKRNFPKLNKKLFST
jgi:hypothetical protein